MGSVFEVELPDGTRRALKRFSADHGNIEFLKERFVSEGRVLKRLSHPRLVHVQDIGIDADGHPYFMMDLVLDAAGESTTLESVRAAGKVSETDAERFYTDLVEALRYCHAQGVVHRDVKLNNILIDAEGHAVLSDFGISRIVNADLRDELQVSTTFVTGETSGTRPVMGTYWYLAPELRTGGTATPASDWYALGIMFFRLLTGLWYEPDTNAFDLLAPYDKVWTKRLKKLLAVNPAERHPRITNDPRSPAPPRRAGHLQSILRVCHSRACHFQAMRGHPTGCRRDLPGRVLRAARPPVAIQSVRNSRETYLRGSSSSARAIPLAISF